MSKIPFFQIPPPKNWQDFESLCCDLWSKIWKDPNTQKNGRGGQAQNGVDIFGCPSDDVNYYGIQCKGKNSYGNNGLTVSELNSEVEKATRFSPKIKCFIIATTSVKDVKIEERAREITNENKRKGLFSVHVFGWDDIIDKLHEYPDVMNKYYSWTQNTNNPNKKLYEWWFEYADIENLEINANIIPFQFFDIRFSEHFLNNLYSYLMNIKTNLRVIPSNSVNQNLMEAIDNFNKIAIDVIEACSEFENKYDYESELNTYWVADIKDMSYHEQGQHIEFKKAVLKFLFYNLVKAANYVIYIRNKLFHNMSQFVEYIGFTTTFNYNYPLIGKQGSSGRVYPLYSKQELKEGKLYQGIENIKKNVRNQIDKR